jgi:tetratricopeptide (TPR) repeat protein
MKLPIFCVAAVVVSLNSFTAAAELATQTGCDPKLVNRAQMVDDIDAAIANNQRCLDERLAELVANEKARGGKAQSKNNLEEPIVGAHLVAKVELLAQKGDLKSAAVALADARMFDQGHEFAAMRWGISGATLDIAEAYVLEKSGDLRGALATYRSTAKRLQDQGWSGTSSVLIGRMASVALQLGDKTSAQQWAESALEVDPGANSVMGQISLQNGDKIEAKRYFERSLDLMSEDAQSTNWTLPVFFLELRSVRIWLAKL